MDKVGLLVNSSCTILDLKGEYLARAYLILKIFSLIGPLRDVYAER